MRRGGNRASLVQAVCHDPRPMHFLMWGVTCSDASASELRSLQVSSDGPAPSPVFLCLARHAHDRWFVAQQCSGTSDLDLHGTGKFGSPLNATRQNCRPSSSRRCLRGCLRLRIYAMIGWSTSRLSASWIKGGVWYISRLVCDNQSIPPLSSPL